MYMHHFTSGVFGHVLFAVLVLWAIFWKGLALWHSAHRKEPKWFIVMLVINTFGILEIVYLVFFAKVKLSALFHTKQ